MIHRELLLCMNMCVLSDNDLQIWVRVAIFRIADAATSLTQSSVQDALEEVVQDRLTCKRLRRCNTGVGMPMQG